MYCDFDGTIVHPDVGDAFFEHFSGPGMWEDNALFQQGRISASEMFRRHCHRMTGLTHEAIERFCQNFVVDPTFPPFLDRMEELGIPVTVLSDGLDVYIHRILGDLIRRVHVFTNHFSMDSRTVASPWSDAECDRCGTCKRNMMVTGAPDEDVLVYIGDGFSDFCPVQYADVVFARDRLIHYCQEMNISFHAYSNFSDIMTTLTIMMTKRRMRQPHRARQLRQALWMRG